MKPSERKGFVYAIVCTKNNKIYIGSTMRNTTQRFNEHKHHLKNKKHHCRYLQHAFNKHGLNSLQLVVLQEVDDVNFLLACEQFAMWRYMDRLMNSIPVSDGIYAANEANRGRKQSAEERKMRSEKIKEAMKYSQAVRNWSDERRARHSIALTGRKQPKTSEQTKLKISLANKGKPCPRLAIENSVKARTSFIAEEVNEWLDMRKNGLSYREIERQTGRARGMIARECRKFENSNEKGTSRKA